MSVFKKTIISASAIIVVIICISDFTSSAHSNAGGAPSAKTGSPGDASNCTGCHTGTATISPGLITSNVPATGYIPGDTYTISASITVAGINKFGFEVSPQNTSGIQKGTLVVTDPTTTKLIGTSGKYLTHKLAGTSGTDSKTWTFDWIAPVSGNGDVTLYAAFIAANSNGTNSGDQVFLSSLLVQENLSAAITNIAIDPNSIVVYPNPAHDIVYIESISKENKIVMIEVMDVTGKRIKMEKYEALSQPQSLDIADLQSGVYILTISTDKNRNTKKIIKN